MRANGYPSDSKAGAKLAKASFLLLRKCKTVQAMVPKAREEWGRVETGTTTVLEPPVPRQGARRIWSDSRGGLWITGWNSGDLFRYDSKTNTWGRWHLPGDRPQPYAVYVDGPARADRMPRQAPAWCDVRWLLDEIGERFRIFTLHALV
jgi:hypothetical protein